jgi:UDP-glucuronate 4-epimerase
MRHNIVLFSVFLISFLVHTNIFSKTVLVTGGAGFIGSHVAKALLSRGDEVIIIDKLHDYYNPELKRVNLKRLQAHQNFQLLHIYIEDICDNRKFENIIAQHSVDVICHIAACAGVRASVEDPELYMRTNINGTLYVLELAKKYKIPHLVIASSSSVYGNCKNVPFKEEYKTDLPCSPYAMTKRADEMLAYTYHYLFNISCTCLRFFTVYGPCGRPDMAPFKFMDLIHHGQTIQQYGDGKSMRDFTYIDDIVDGIIRAIDKPLAYEVVNLGRGEPVYLHQFIHILEEVMDKKAIIEVVRKPQSDVDMTHADISKARALLGYDPKVSLKEGLKKMYAWYISDYLRVLE